MALKIFRCFYGGYTPDYQKLSEMGYKVFQAPKLIITVNSTSHGFAAVSGTTRKLGEKYYPVPVCLFRKDNRQLIWETKSKTDGSYRFRNVAEGLPCFVVAFDPNNQFNAVIQDNVVPK